MFTHRNISFIKSGLRIFGSFGLAAGQLFVPGVLFLVAEILGVVEEIV